jgi:hypothetical protein
MSDGTPGQYYGRPTLRLDTAHCWIEFLAVGGPRIVGFGFPGGGNVLGETPQASWDVGHGQYDLLGGHRLWFAPETPDCSVPDSTGLTLASIDDAPGPAVRLTGAVEAPTGLRKTFEVRLDPESAAVSVRHIVANEGSAARVFSPWPITQLPLGGVATVELAVPPTENSSNPNQLLAMFPYASWTDARLALGTRSFTVTATPGAPFKIGAGSTLGVASYLREGVLFTKSFDPAAGAGHADLGSNIEIYCDDRTIELESLGPLVRLAPGDSVTHDERWELRRVGSGIRRRCVESIVLSCAT